MAAFTITRNGIRIALAIAPGHLKTGDTIATVSDVSTTTGLTVASEQANAAQITLDDGTTVATGRAIVFNLTATTTCPLSSGYPEHRVVFEYTTTVGERSRVGAAVNVTADE